MKTLNDYMAMSYRMEIVEDKDEGGFVVSYPDLPGCITCGETVESAVANALDAKKTWLEAALEEGRILEISKQYLGDDADNNTILIREYIEFAKEYIANDQAATN